MKVAIIGAGLAGLVTAKKLVQAGISVEIFEVSDGIGGRVRSDIVDGFILDRGFQVLFDSYPTVQRHLDTKALDLKPFDPGAIVCLNGTQSILTDPIRDTADALPALMSNIASINDKIKMLRLSNEVKGSPIGLGHRSLDRLSTRDYLNQLGFSDSIVDNFFVPFFGGIFLDRSLSTSAAIFRYYFQMLSLGRATVPANGMGAITQQLADNLGSSVMIHLNTRIDRVITENEMVKCIETKDSTRFDADKVVVATDADTAMSLTNGNTDNVQIMSTAVYFVGDKPITQSKKILLNANQDAFVNNAQALTNIAPSYAPEGKHLLGATVLGDLNESDDVIASKALADIGRMVQSDKDAIDALLGYRTLKVYRIPFSQFAQPPGTLANRPIAPKAADGIYIAGEWTDYSSIDGSMLSGERCAEALLKDA